MLEDLINQVNQAISIAWLHALLRFHLRPINVVVYHGLRWEILSWDELGT